MRPRRRGAWLLALATACESTTPIPDDPVETLELPTMNAGPAPVARVEAESGWLDLIAQRPAAVHWVDGRTWIDMGHPAALRHLELAIRTPWRVGESVDGRNASVLGGRTATLQLPLDGDNAPGLNEVEVDGELRSDLAIAITLRPLVEKQSVTVLVNEHAVANLRLADEWARRTVTLPRELISAGENRVRLHFRRVGPWADGDPEVDVSAAVEAVEIGDVATIREARRPVHAIREDGQGRLLVPAGHQLVYYLVPPRRGRLRVRASGAGGLEFRASTDVDHREGRPPIRLRQDPLSSSVRDVAIDLAGYAGVPIRLEVGVTGEEGGVAVFERLGIEVPRARPVDRRPRKLRDVYVFAVEGLRADTVTSMDATRRRAFPAIDRFVSESLVFERAYAVGAAAVPSHAGWLSSVAPPVHLTVRGTFVADAQRLLSEVLDRAGYFTVALTANTDVTPQRGLSQGFASHRVFTRGPARENDAEALLAAVGVEIDKRPSPRFVYTTLNDPQAPYDPPRDLVRDLDPPEGAPSPHLTHMWVGRVRMGKVVPDASHVRFVRTLYRAEVSVIDRAFEGFIAKLEQDERLDDAIVVLMGIHGEEFLEHAGAGHGRSLFEESIRVPLVIRAPRLLPPGRVTTGVDLLDLAPTLTDLLAVDAPRDWQGESLVPLIDDPVPPPRLLLSYLGDGSRAAVLGDYKLVQGPGYGADAQSFYDLRRDAAELENRRADGGIALRMLRTALWWHMRYGKDWKRTRWGTGASLRREFSIDNGL